MGEYLQFVSNFFLENVAFKLTIQMAPVVDGKLHLTTGRITISIISRIYSTARNNLLGTLKQAYLSPAE